MTERQNQKLNSKRFQEKAKSRKSLTRLMAVQIFYQYYFFNCEIDLEKIKNDLIENYALQEDEKISSYQEKIDANLLNNLVLGLSLDVKRMDDEIATFANDKKKLESIDPVLMQILRLAAFELKFMTNIPAKVVIDEYVGIAASFFDSTKVTFANAIIDELSKKLRA